MERAHLQHHQIERSQPFADRGVFRGQSGIATKEYGMARHRMTIEDHRVALRSFRPRPEKCCDGAAVTVSRCPASYTVSHQSSSTMRSALRPRLQVRAHTE